MTADDALRAWLDWLAHERRASPRTLEAYGHAGRNWIGFLEGHRGGPQRLNDLGGVGAAGG
jgi:Phage integrase, N-terminal SAM-like domain.